MDLWRAISQQLNDWQQAGLTHMPQLEEETSPKTKAPHPSRQPLNTNRDSSHPGDVPYPSNLHSTSRPDSSTHDRTESYTSTQSHSQNLDQQEVMPPKKSQSASISLPQTTNAKYSCAEKIKLLGKVQDKVSACQKCPLLAETRTKTVFGVGNPEAQIMFIGEAPGADEDEQGIPFVGRAGQLLDKIIEACGFKRDEIYICNILRCRPPGNRAPLPDEAANCREYLDAQIRIVNPKYIICWGATAAQNLLNTKDAIGTMRQKFFDYQQAKVTCTYHPSYLLRNPPMKKEVWEDMKFFLREIGIDPETVPGSRK